MWLLIHLLQHHVRYQWNSSLFAWLVSIFSDSTLIHKRLSRIMHTENIFRKDWSVECLDVMKEQLFFMEWSSLVIRPETLELKFFLFSGLIFISSSRKFVSKIFTLIFHIKVYFSVTFIPVIENITLQILFQIIKLPSSGCMSTCDIRASKLWVHVC